MLIQLIIHASYPALLNTADLTHVKASFFSDIKTFFFELGLFYDHELSHQSAVNLVGVESLNSRLSNSTKDGSYIPLSFMSYQ